MLTEILFSQFDLMENSLSCVILLQQFWFICHCGFMLSPGKMNMYGSILILTIKLGRSSSDVTNYVQSEKKVRFVRMGRTILWYQKQFIVFSRDV